MKRRELTLLVHAFRVSQQEPSMDSMVVVGIVLLCFCTEMWLRFSSKWKKR